jgi:RNA polymerase I-specific transcription initiation factor RRN6
LDPALPVGSASRGTPLAVVPMVSGTVKSEPCFEPALDAELNGVGYDYIRNDADGGVMRLDVRSTLKYVS